MRTRTSTAKGRRRRRLVCALAVAAAALAVAGPAQAVTYVYVTDSSSNNAVLQYAADSTGALSPLGQPTVPAGRMPTTVAVSPNARWVYVGNSANFSAPVGVSQFDLGQGGL